MNYVSRWMIPLAVLVLFCLAGCGQDFGKVNQGRVIAFDKEKGLITFIQDSNYAVPGKPVYDILPPVSVRIPVDAHEMGPEPAVGGRLKLDTEKRQIVIFDNTSQTIKKLEYTLIDQAEGVSKTDPRVVDVKFPIVDREKKTITVYSGRQKILTTFSLPDEYFAMPDDTWKAGDEIRYYYKDPTQALRLMNITKTDIFKK